MPDKLQKVILYCPKCGAKLNLYYGMEAECTNFSCQWSGLIKE